MFKNKSKCTFISALLGSAYLIYLIVYFAGAMSSGSSSDQAAGAIATALVTPHMALVALACIFMWLGFFLKKPAFVLTGAILYTVAGVLFIPYIFFVIPSFILGFVGFSKQKKINASVEISSEE